MFKSWIFISKFWRKMNVWLCLSKPFAMMQWFLLFFFSVPVLKLPHWTLTKSPTAYSILAESSLLRPWLQVGQWALPPAGAASLPHQCQAGAQWKPLSISTTTSSTSTTTSHSSRGWWNLKACQFSWAKVKGKHVAAPWLREALSYIFRAEESSFFCSFLYQHVHIWRKQQRKYFVRQDAYAKYNSTFAVQYRIRYSQECTNTVRSFQAYNFLRFFRRNLFLTGRLIWFMFFQVIGKKSHA